MTHDDLMFLHLFTVVPCLVIGTVLLVMRKGTKIHKQLGRIYMVLMLFTATVTLFMPFDGPTLLNDFGWIHLFSILTITPFLLLTWRLKKEKSKCTNAKWSYSILGH